MSSNTSSETFSTKDKSTEDENTDLDDCDLNDTQDTQAITSSVVTSQENEVWAKLLPISGFPNKLELTKIETLIGRDPSCDIHLEIPQMSSKHCYIRRDLEDDIAILQDISTNGTWVNRKKQLKTFISLKSGDEITFVPGSKKRKRKKISFSFFPSNFKRKTLKVDEEYDVVKSLGTGAFAEVKLGVHRVTNEKFAIKIIDKSNWEKMKQATSRKVSLLDEVKIMKQANHKNIVKVHEYYQEKDGKIYVVMDYCDGGDMLEYIQNNGVYPNDKCISVFKQLVEAIEYLHSLKIAHRDLKPDNILLADKEGKHVRISDFGISRKSSESMYCQTIIGTPLYQAPEVHEQRYSNVKQGYDGKLSDYWSLGIILYIMLVAAPPANNPEEIKELVEQKKLNFYDEDVSDTAQDLLYKLLQIDPRKRIKAKDIYKHPYMLGYRKLNDNNYINELNLINLKQQQEEKNNNYYSNNNNNSSNNNNNNNNNNISNNSNNKLVNVDSNDLTMNIINNNNNNNNNSDNNDNNNNLVGLSHFLNTNKYNFQFGEDFNYF